MSYQVFGIGELLWDVFPTHKTLGGAPVNFAYHAQQLGAEATAISAVGSDSLGMEIINELNKNGLKIDCIALLDNIPTGTVQVEIDDRGIPSYIINEHVAWDVIPDSAKYVELASKADVICFGSLAQRNEITRQTVLKVLKATPENALRVFDINLRQHYYSKEIIEASLNSANVFKVNEDELPVVCKLFAISADNEIESLKMLIDRFQLKLIALTKGENGSVLYDGKEKSVHPGYPPKVLADTVGAGDSFTAAICIGYLNGFPLAEINEKANQISSFICSQKGAMPTIPKELTSIFRFHKPYRYHK